MPIFLQNYSKKMCFSTKKHVFYQKMEHFFRFMVIFL